MTDAKTLIAAVNEWRAAKLMFNEYKRKLAEAEEALTALVAEDAKRAMGNKTHGSKTFKLHNVSLQANIVRVVKYDDDKLLKWAATVDQEEAQKYVVPRAELRNDVPIDVIPDDLKHAIELHVTYKPLFVRPKED